MPYIRPPLFVRHIFNPIAMRLGISGTQALAVVGRRTGRLHRVPVLPAAVNGRTYLVSPRGDTDWVRNLRAAGRCTLGPHGRERLGTAVEVPVAERGPIIAEYRRVAGRAVRSFFDRLPDDADHPVFAITPI